MEKIAELISTKVGFVVTYKGMKGERAQFEFRTGGQATTTGPSTFGINLDNCYVKGEHVAVVDVTVLNSVRDANTYEFMVMREQVYFTLYYAKEYMEAWYMATICSL